MRPYSVYGLGNALLDIEFNVDEPFLLENELEKSVMVLIDEAQHHLLMDKLGHKMHIHACGGSAANTLIAASQLGAKVFSSCKVADDESGHHYHHNLSFWNIDTNLDSQAKLPGITGKCIVLVTPDAERTMFSFLGITETFSEEQIIPEVIAQSQYIFLEGYLASSPTGRSAAIAGRQYAEQNHTKIAMTLSDVNIVRHFKPELYKMLGHRVDLLFSNQQEALLFSGTTQITEACDYLKTLARQFVITLGAEGALVYDGNHLDQVAGYPTLQVNTSGAGDVFAGTVLYAINHGRDLIQAADMACFTASKIVAKPGPRFENGEVAQLLNELKEKF